MVGFPAENALAATSLITSGLLEKFPNLKIILSHGGGNFSTTLPRLDHGWKTMDEIRRIIPKRPSEYAKMLYYDTLVYDVKTLNYLIDTVGANQLLIGSDYPFVIREKFPGHWLEQMEISQEMIDAIRYKNAFQLFEVNYLNLI